MMPKRQIDLPAYPASAGPVAAAQADAYIGRYRQRVTDIQREIAECEVAFEKALARADAAAATRTRIDDLAAGAQRLTNR